MTMRMNVIYVVIFLSVLVFSCKKASEVTVKEQNSVSSALALAGATSKAGASVFSLSNQNLLKFVLSGVGGFVQVDSTCTSCPVDSMYLVQFPSYTPPINSGGMLSFFSMDDYNSFVKAANLMQDLWKDPGIDYEGSTDEMKHLGEESLNALDSILAFQSLRSQYDLNEFYNHDWADTASLYVEDDDYQMVLNREREVKIGDKYYKFVTDNICGIVANSNIIELEALRAGGIFVNHPDVIFYNELSGLYEPSPKPTGANITQDCADFTLLASANANSPNEPATLSTYVQYGPVLPHYPGDYRSVKGTYTIDWGDGTTEVLTGYFSELNWFRHNYQFPVTGVVIKNIMVKCKIIPQPNPTAGYNRLLEKCTSLVSRNFTAATTINLDSYNYPDCMGTSIKRFFNGNELNISGKRYRLECKLKQKPSPAFGVSHIKAIGIFTKQKGNRWKTTQSIGEMIISLRGNVYDVFNCNTLRIALNTGTSVNKKRKIKFITRDWLLPFNYYTKRNLPMAINADFIWKYNNNRAFVANYNEVLKP